MPEDSVRLQSLREMLADDPDDPFLRYGMAMEFKGLERLDEALHEFERIRAEHPDYVPAYYHHAATLQNLARDQEAIQVLRDGLTRAEAAQDTHARDELQELLDDLEA